MIQEFSCSCGAVNDCITDSQRFEAVPHVGDFTLCFACGQIFCFDAEMVPRPSSIDDVPFELRGTIVLYERIRSALARKKE